VKVGKILAVLMALWGISTSHWTLVIIAFVVYQSAAQEYRQASAQQEQEYAETAAVLAEDQALSAEEVAEVSQLWRKLVKMYHPDRFAHEPGKLDTYVKLTSAINRAKDELVGPDDFDAFVAKDVDVAVLGDFLAEQA
jgi:hypothetical protein